MNTTWSGRSALSWLFVLLVVAAVGAACSSGGGTSSAPAVKLAFVTNNASEFWKIAAAGVRKYEAEGKVQVDVKMPPNGTTEEQNQILENLASQGYDAIAVSAIAPNDQVPMLNHVAAKTDAHHVRLRRAGIEPPALHRHQQLRGRQGARRRDRQAAARRAARWRCSSARSRPTTPPSVSRASRTRSRATRSRSSTSARTTPTAPRRARTSRTSSTRIAISTSSRASGPTTARRSPRRSRRWARRARCWRPCSTRRTGTLQAIANGTIAVHRRAEAVRVRLPREQVDARARHRRARPRRAAIPPAKMIDTGVEVINKDNVADFSRSSSPSSKQ